MYISKSIDCILENDILLFIQRVDIDNFMKGIPWVYTLVVNTIYLSLSTQVTEGTVFRKHMIEEIGNGLCPRLV